MAVISFIRTFKGSDKNVQISVTAFFSEFGISNNERKVVFGKMSELVGKNDFEGLLKLSGLVDPFVILFHS